MEKGRQTRSIEDIERTVRAIAEHFKAEEIVIIGSQAILVNWPEAPDGFLHSFEVDAYPGNADRWQRENPGFEASEEINALFGLGSQFHETHGFYIDGVDERTAVLPKNWRDRAKVHDVWAYDRWVKVIAPEMNDLIVSKLLAHREKDLDFIAAYHKIRPLDFPAIRALMQGMELDPALAERAYRMLAQLESK